MQRKVRLDSMGNYAIFVSKTESFQKGGGIPAKEVPALWFCQCSQHQHDVKLSGHFAPAKPKNGCCLISAAAFCDGSRDCYLTSFIQGLTNVRGSMPAKSEIDKIIGGLELGESRYIRARLRGKKRRLFDFYLQEKKFDNVDIATLFPQLNTQRVATVRAQLEDQLCLLLGEYHARHSPQEKIRSLRLKGMAYLDKAQIHAAIKTLRLAYHLAVQHEEFLAAMEIAHLLESYEEKEHIAESVLAYREIAESLLLLHQALEIKKLIGSPKHEAALKLLEIDRQPTSIKAKCYLFRAQAICFLILKNFDECLLTIESAHSLIESNTDLLHDNVLRDTAIALYLGHCTILIGIGEHVKAEQSVLALEQLYKRMHLAQPSAFYYFKLEVKLEAAWQSKNIPAFLSLVQDLGTFLASAIEDDSKYRVLIMAMVAQRLVWSKEYDKAHEWIVKILKSRTKRISAPIHATIAILDLICLYKRDDMESLHEACRRSAYLFKSRKLKGTYTDSILRAFNAIAKAPENGINLLKALATKLDTIKTDEASYPLIEAFNLPLWIKQQEDS